MRCYRYVTAARQISVRGELIVWQSTTPALEG